MFSVCQEQKGYDAQLLNRPEEGKADPADCHQSAAPSEWQMAILSGARFQRIGSTHCARDGPGSNGSPKYWVSRATFPSRNSMMLTVYDGRPS
jgi:hypothetical protein